MSPREVAQSRSQTGRRSVDALLVGFIFVVMGALALGGTGLLH